MDLLRLRGFRLKRLDCVCDAIQWPLTETSDTTMDMATDMAPDGRWMTYAELAAARRIDRHSAVRLVIRHQWRRQKDNQGRQRVFVPTEWLSRDKAPDAATDTGTDMAPDLATDTMTAFRTAIEAKDGEISALRATIAAKEGELATARQVATDARQDAQEASRRAERAEQGREAERVRADALRDRLETAEGAWRAAEEAVELATREAQVAQDAAAALLREDDARRAGGRLARAWRAWRGR